MRTIHTDHEARTFRTSDGAPIPSNRIASAYASTEGTPELLIIDGYGGTGNVIGRFALHGERIDLSACEGLILNYGYAVARVLVDGQTQQDDAWTLTPDGCVATVVRHA